MFRFGNFFRGNPPKAEEENLQQKTEEPLADQERPEPAEEPQYLIEPAGDLLELWKQWKENAPAPGLSLTDERGIEGLHMGPGEMERERIRLKLSLEKSARLRRQLIRTVEEKGDTAALAATCSCFLSKDRRVAWIFVFPPTACGNPLVTEDIQRVLQKEKITVGVDETAVLRAADPEHYFELIPVAVGTPAVEGENGRIIERVPREAVQEVMIDQEGNADYRAISYVQVVSEHAILCDIIPPVPGQEGQTVDGMPIKPRSVKPARVPKGDGTLISEDGLQLLAARDGHLEYRQDCFCIQPVLDIDGDIDYSTGNIDFPGDVHISGDVREGFRVAAGGSLMIDGLVERAEVAAGSELVITKGVVGDKRAALYCGGNLRVKYLENCTIYAGGCVYADCAVNTQIFCDDTVSVTSGRGSIIGGTMTVGVKVKARMIGARSGRQTDLVLGVQPYLQWRKQADAQRMETLEREEAETEKTIYTLTHLSSHMRSVDREQQLARAEETMKVIQTEKTALEEQLEAASVPIDLNQCGVECGTIYPITTISVSGKVWTIQDVRNAYQATYDKKLGELKELL